MKRWIHASSDYDRLKFTNNRGEVDYLPTWYIDKPDEEVEKAKEILINAPEGQYVEFHEIKIPNEAKLRRDLKKEGFIKPEIEEIIDRIANGATIDSAIQRQLDLRGNTSVHASDDPESCWRLYSELQDQFYGCFDSPEKARREMDEYGLAPYEWSIVKTDYEPHGINFSSNIQCSTTTLDKSKSDCQWMVGLYWDIDGHVMEITGVNGYPLFSCEVTETWISEDTGKELKSKSWYAIKEDSKGYIYLQNKKYPDYKLYLQSALNYTEDKIPAEFDELDFIRDGYVDNKNSNTVGAILDRFIKEANEGDYYTRVKVLVKGTNDVLYSGRSLDEAKAELAHWDCLDDEAESYWYDDSIVIKIVSDEYSEDDDDEYTPSATRGDYSPSNPWDAPGMSIRDFI